MNPIRRANLRERSKAALLAGLIYWIGMTLAFSVLGFLDRPLHGSRDFLGIAGACLAGAILFGYVLSLFHPLMAPPSADVDGGDEELAVPARSVPPSPVLEGKAFQDLNEPTA